jgi:Antibiotic biosynthesis monooxygenase.
MAEKHILMVNVYTVAAEKLPSLEQALRNVAELARKSEGILVSYFYAGPGETEDTRHLVNVTQARSKADILAMVKANPEYIAIAKQYGTNQRYFFDSPLFVVKPEGILSFDEA